MCRFKAKQNSSLSFFCNHEYNYNNNTKMMAMTMKTKMMMLVITIIIIIKQNPSTYDIITMDENSGTGHCRGQP